MGEDDRSRDFSRGKSSAHLIPAHARRRIADRVGARACEYCERQNDELERNKISPWPSPRRRPCLVSFALRRIRERSFIRLLEYLTPPDTRVCAANRFLRAAYFRLLAAPPSPGGGAGGGEGIDS